MIERVIRKSMLIRPSGRSTDFISPSFGYGCLYNCSYCYMKRHKDKGLTVASNTGDILTAINNHAFFTPVDKPNQTHSQFTTYDISCNEDFALHAKHHDWKKIFEFFRDHPVAMGSFATKYVNPILKDFNPEGKVRIRFSLMPQHKSDLHEPKTSKIIDRIKAIDAFIDAGYDVHVNYSPIIVYDGWLDDYADLFHMMNEHVKYKDQVLAECIFLTHNFKKHTINLGRHPETEVDLWVLTKQELKTSQYGGENVRYKLGMKSEYINQFKQLHKSIVPWNKIRYIF
jgi:spore photoproduct lyase|tara:strand:+ start:5354 stop:6208 length:855 start_codon:yes stop_codon:yes gene_type:complete